MMDASSASSNEEKRKETIYVITALTFALSFVLIGIPLWWKTTDVYRVSLPYSEIELLPSLQIGHVVPVTIIIADNEILESQLWEELTLSSNDDDDLSQKSSDLIIQYAWKMRIVSEGEELALQTCGNLFDMEKYMEAKSTTEEEVGEYSVVIYDNKIKKFSVSELVACHRRTFIPSNKDMRSLGQAIRSTVRTIIQADILQKIYSPPSTHERKKPEKDRMRSLTASTAFDITFSLVVPEPQLLKPKWRIEEAIQAYIMPFIKRISPIIDADITSQILYMATFPVQSKAQNDSHYISEESLPSIINPIEDKLGSYASVNPNLNFVVYIPPRKQSPLYILDKKESPVSTNAFLSPRWGGFLILNVNTTDKTELYEPDLDMSAIMGVFLSQLKLLLGLPEVTAINENMQVLRSPDCCDWEMDFLMRKTTQEQLSAAVSSLYSLGQLLQTISNIVINDDVGEKIYFALSSIRKSVNALEQGFLEEASKEARNAFNASEEAFFDPSLLALLYFPEDQKYAIYIPLFLPISIPVIMSLKLIWSYWKNRRTKVKKD